MKKGGFKLPEKYFEQFNESLFQQIQADKNRRKTKFKIRFSVSVASGILLLFCLKPLFDMNNETTYTENDITSSYLWDESVLFAPEQNGIGTDHFSDVDIDQDVIFDYVSYNSIYIENHLSFTNY